MDIKKLDKTQAAILSLYTGILCGSFADMHEYAEKIYGGPIWTHQFGNEEFVEQLKQLAKSDFMKVVNQ